MELLAAKRRITENVVHMLGGDNLVPVHLQGIGAMYRGGVDEREATEVLTEFLGYLHVHLMVSKPEGYLRDLGRELFDLNAVELIHIDLHFAPQRVQFQLLHFLSRAKNFQLQQSQFPIRDDQKIPASASRIEKFQPGKLFMQLKELVRAPLRGLELGPEVVEEQRLDKFQDILFTRVMRAEIAPPGGTFLVHDALEERTKNSRRYAAPIKRATVEQQGPHCAVASGYGQRLFKKPAVHIGESHEYFVEALLPFTLGCVQDLKQHRQLRYEVGAVFLGAVLDEITERTARLKERGVLGKEAEEQPNEHHFKDVSLVARGAQTVVELAHALGGLNVDRVLLGYFLRCITGDEAKELDVLVKVFKREVILRFGIKIVEPDAGEVGDDDVAGQIAFGQAFKIIQSLLIR